jgi:type II secretory pathway predicted ATPase ExeA
MKTPKLTPKIARNDLALSDAIIAVLTGAKGKRRKLTKAILRLQRRLQRAVSREAWHLYLHIDEAVNERESYVEDLLVRWAFREGRRSVRR